MLLQKLWFANDNRKSRLHDRHGQIVSFRRVVKNFPRSFVSAIRIKLFGSFVAHPWISYDATRVLERMLVERPCDVLEFGSGMSTLWFAQRVKRLCSIEHDSKWFKDIKSRLDSSNLSASIEYVLEDNRDSYSSFKQLSQEKFDIIFIDGPWRSECLLKSMHLLKKGGIIYLDNTDAESSSGEPGEIDMACQNLRKFIKENDGDLERFTDFIPGCFFVTEGYLGKLHR